jgi:hypothetical protein
MWTFTNIFKKRGKEPMGNIKNDIEILTDLAFKLQEFPADEEIKFSRKLRREKKRLMRDYNRLNFKVQQEITKPVYKRKK